MHAREKKQALRLKRIRAFILLIILIVAIVSAINIIKRRNNKEQVIDKDLSKLSGTYVYNDSIKYIFEKNNEGTLYDNGNEYKFTYKIQDQNLILTFEDKSVQEATYTAYFLNNNLKLIGGTGTIGGEYILVKGK